MFRLLVVLLCLIVPVRAITLIPLVEGLSHPWGLVLLPGGEFLISERTGRLLRIDPQGERHTVQGLPPIASAGQGGLLDLAQDKEGWIYLSYSEPGQGGAGTAVARARLQDDRLHQWQLLFRQQPKMGGSAHFGSRLLTGDDGYLYITLGDRYRGRDQAQSLDNHLGKTIRLHLDGRV
ncbi:PQQ-dependent sugar dehydrogenase [Aeromonas salmonicida]